MAKEWAKAFYNSKAWLDCRAAYISTIPGGVCEKCVKKNEEDPKHVIKLGLIVHHIEPLTPENINDPNITLNFDNLEYDCKECHDEYEGHGVSECQPMVGEGYSFDDNGMLVYHTPPEKNVDIKF